MHGYHQLYELFTSARDRRGGKGREHILSEMLFITFVAILAGCNDAEAVADFLERNEAWFRKIVLLPGGIPAHDMVMRVLVLPAPEEVGVCARARARGFAPAAGRPASPSRTIARLRRRGQPAVAG